MKLLETLVGTPLAGAVGWTLLHSMWEGAIVSVALAAVLMATRSPRVRYAAACAAMLMMLGGFGVTFVRMLPEGAQNATAVKKPAFPGWNIDTSADGGNPSNTVLAEVVPWLAPFWIAGVWIFYLRHVAGWISVSRMRQRGVCCASEQWQRELAGLSARLHLSRPIVLLESCLADAPMVLGHFRPHILMPVGLLAGLPAAQVEAILLHELAHIRRHDYLVNVLQRSVEGLLFYHPAVWWMSRVMRNERENCCDDLVVEMSGDAHEYARALAALEQNRWSGCEPAVAARGGNLVKRIRRLLYPQGPNGIWTSLCAAIVFVATAAIAVVTLQAAPAQQNAEAKLQAKKAAPYKLWLNEDVVYIISDVERAAYLKLTTDEEREHFIKQFWEVRNPTPNSAENAFQIEHYRRIAFANKHYGTRSGRQGWQTDRGYIYIVYGPPDEIDSHPVGGSPGQPPYPFEDWRFKHVDGVGDDVSVRFIDRTKTGDYHVAPGNGR
ncbi:MAG TPA: M56 family metallopeptidase [Bryobacteraceae bacterium]|nr:M56 family metallopeptidase [Bryobacteraceae bacterium]